MIRRLELLLRIRTEAEERAALAHGRATAVVQDSEAAAAAALGVLCAARRDAQGEPLTSVAALQEHGAHLRRLERRVTEEQSRVMEARRCTWEARDAHVAARRETRAITSLCDRERERRRRARDAAQEEELAESAAITLRCRG